MAKLYSITIKDCSSKDIIKKIYRQITDRNVFLINDLFSEYLKYFYNSITKPQITQF